MISCKHHGVVLCTRKCLEERDFGWVVLYSLVQKGHKTKPKEANGDGAHGDYSFLNLNLKLEVLAAKSMQKILKILRAYENLAIKTTIVCCVWLAAEQCNIIAGNGRHNFLQFLPVEHRSYIRDFKISSEILSRPPTPHFRLYRVILCTLKLFT